MTNLPDSLEGMIGYIESGYDRATLLGALEEAQAQADQAAAQLAAARQALAAHEATTMTDPIEWAAQRRRLYDVIPLFEDLAGQKAADRDAAQRAIFDARRPVIEALGAQLHAELQAASASDALREDELRRQIDEIRAGKSPESQAVSRAWAAFNNAAGALRHTV